jgi:hypothetical protein
VFFNNPKADPGTPKEAADGYAGSFYIFGHPHCWGDAGHCTVPPGPLHGYDDRRPHHLIPYTMNLDVTDAVRLLTEGRGQTFTVTVLPVVRKGRRYRVDDAQLRFEHLSLVTYD